MMKLLAVMAALTVLSVTAIDLNDDELAVIAHFGMDADAIASSSISHAALDEELLHKAKAEKGIPDYLDEDELKVLRHFGYNEVAVEKAMIPKETVDKVLAHEIRDEIRQQNGIPDYLDDDEKLVLRHFGYSVIKTEAERYPKEEVDKFLATQIKHEREGTLGDYLDADEKLVLEHFGVNPVAVEERHIPSSVVDEKLAKKIQHEREGTLGDYLDADEKLVLDHFGVDPVAVEKLHVPSSVVDEKLAEAIQIENSQQHVGRIPVDNSIPADLPADYVVPEYANDPNTIQPIHLDHDERIVAEHFNYDIDDLENNGYGRKMVDKTLAKEVMREKEESYFDIDRLRLLNEFKRVRGLEKKMGNVNHAELFEE